MGRGTNGAGRLLAMAALAAAAWAGPADNPGISAYLAGRPFDAVAPLREALKRNPAAVREAQFLGAALAETGRCAEAMPLLRRPVAPTAEKSVRRMVSVDRVRCAMALNQPDEAAESLRLLTRGFPDDPDVLYLATHVYSQLSIRASRQLLFKAPESYQVHELNAEALEAQGKWDDAAREYRTVLEKNPRLPGIHYRLGRLILSKPRTDATTAEARREFEAELKIDPGNAGAEYVLGELARQAEDWQSAVEHFSRAARLDASFTEAYVGLGRALLGAGRPADAIAPLQTAVRLDPRDPEPHFHLATAYQRAGRRADAAREFQAHQQASDRRRQETDQMQRAVSGIPPGGGQ